MESVTFFPFCYTGTDDFTEIKSHWKSSGILLTYKLILISSLEDVKTMLE